MLLTKILLRCMLVKQTEKCLMGLKPRRTTTVNNMFLLYKKKSFSHDFDWNNAEILDREHNYRRRTVSEMTLIRVGKFKDDSHVP